MMTETVCTLPRPTCRSATARFLLLAAVLFACLADARAEGEQRLLTALGVGERSLDELVRETDIPSGAAASAMTMLVLKGLVVQRPGNVFARKRRPKR